MVPLPAVPFVAVGSWHKWLYGTRWSSQWSGNPPPAARGSGRWYDCSSLWFFLEALGTLIQTSLPPTLLHSLGLGSYLYSLACAKGCDISPTYLRVSTVLQKELFRILVLPLYTCIRFEQRTSTYKNKNHKKILDQSSVSDTVWHLDLKMYMTSSFMGHLPGDDVSGGFTTSLGGLELSSCNLSFFNIPVVVPSIHCS